MSGLLSTHCELSASRFMSSVLEMVSIRSNIVSHHSFVSRNAIRWVFILSLPVIFLPLSVSVLALFLIP